MQLTRLFRFAKIKRLAELLYLYIFMNASFLIFVRYISLRIYFRSFYNSVFILQKDIFYFHLLKIENFFSIRILIDYLLAVIRIRTRSRVYFAFEKKKMDDIH